MDTDKKRRISVICVYLCSSVVLFSSGCGRPSKANVELRKQNQALQNQVADLKRQHETDLARIRNLRSSTPTVPTLPTERLEKLVTTYGLKIGRLTGEADLDSNRAGDEGLKIYVAPVDRTGEAIKA